MNHYLINALLLIILSSCTGHALERDDRPNIVIIVADDLGYSDLGCFGSEISTPNIDALAAAGRIFTGFYTAATCSPTRAMLLAGVDNHQAGLGDMAERMVSVPEEWGQPGYEGYLNDRVISFVKLIKEAGYRTYMTGKWHLGMTPDRSPMSNGFDKSFALMDAYADHFYPDPEYTTFWENDNYGSYPAGKFSTDFYTDKVLDFLKEDKKSDSPFFLYAAYTAPHWPLQAPDRYIQKYSDVYNDGYDKLRERRFNGLKKKGLLSDKVTLPALPSLKGNLYDISDQPLAPWDSLNEKEQEIEAKKMEIYAAMVENLDYNIGRIISYLRKVRAFENTLFMFFSDNGASSLDANEVHDPFNPLPYMGTAGSFVAYGPNWAHACSAVNRYYKGYSSEGGIHSPLIIKMPFQTTGLDVAPDFITVCDVAPTILELAETTYPGIYKGRPLVPLQGQSMLPFLRGESRDIHDQDFVIGWELFGRAAVRQGPWKIVCIEPPFGTGSFELFNLDTDPAESNNLADTYPEKLQEMVAHWNNYVQKNGVIWTEK
ncbi:MAG: arylsulfatase [Saprospiraceae bacterium]|nr:arylsulfatase [Saprospiraceae bacterium]